MKYSYGNKRISGVAVPLSAIRTETSPGCGEYPDLAVFGRMAADWKMQMIQLLPVQDTGVQTSPYSALSAFALHPLYIRIQDLPELSPIPGGETIIPAARKARISAQADALTAQFRDAELVPHEELLAAKLSLLGQVWEAGARVYQNGSLDEWIAANSWVRGYAAFVELKRRNSGLPWWLWPAYRDPSGADIEGLWANPEWTEGLRRTAWMQMRAEEQFSRASRSLNGLGIELMGDLPILMNEDSAEVWADRKNFMIGSIAGAPPDMYSGLGQNWGFPIYDWEHQARDGFSFWKRRLAAADKFYTAYRIDHVLGFFRIWALSAHEKTGYLGRFVPDSPVSLAELSGIGFCAERIRWLSKPHVRLDTLRSALGEAEAEGVIRLAFDRIGGEDLLLFKESIRGERDISSLDITAAAKDVLEIAWRDRVLYEYEPGLFVPSWNHSTARAWPTLSENERWTLENLFASKRAEAEKVWESGGRRILAELTGSVPMLACAEDLGSVPPCVPVVLAELGILGLRVLRWTREWDRQGSPFVPLGDYPGLTVACPSVHDSTCLREWWEKEAERDRVWALAAESCGRDIGPCPEVLAPAHISVILEAIARSGSRIVIYPVQDLLALSERFRASDSSTERINIPGTVGGRNWAYRMGSTVESIAKDADLRGQIARLAGMRA